MGLTIEPKREMVVTEKTKVRDLATGQQAEPKKPGLTPAEATKTGK